MILIGDAFDIGCSLLQYTVAHEVGHLFGLPHSSLPDTLMFENVSLSYGPYCSPQEYDIITAMTNYQSRD